MKFIDRRKDDHFSSSALEVRHSPLYARKRLRKKLIAIGSMKRIVINDILMIIAMQERE